MDQDSQSQEDFQIRDVNLVGDDIVVNVEGDMTQICGRVTVVENGRTMLWESYKRKRQRLRAKERKEKTLLTAEELEEREKELELGRAKEQERRWAIREGRMGARMTKEEHERLDREEKEAMACKGKAAVDPEKKMAPLSAFFPKIVKKPQEIQKSDSVPTDTKPDTPVCPADPPTRGGTEGGSDFKDGMMVYLRLAFLDNENVDSMNKKDASVYIRKEGVIGQVRIERMVEEHVAILDLEEFSKLSDSAKRKAGKDVLRHQFAALKKALETVDGKVDVKYLTKQNRNRGENHKWTDTQIEYIKNAVNHAKKQWPTTYYSQAAKTLRATHSGTLGNISKDQVRNVYKAKVEMSGEPKNRTGRPSILSPQCLEELKAFVNESGNQNTVDYYIESFQKIIDRRGEAESLTKSGNPRQYLRKLLSSECPQALKRTAHT